MKILNILIPPFFRRLDAYLLTNHPFIWKTYAHYFLFYSFFIANVFLVSMALLWPVSIEEVPNYYNVIHISGLTTFVLSFPFLYWLYRLNRGKNNIFTWKQALRSIGMYLFCIFSLYTNIWAFTFVRQYKIEYVSKQAGFEADYESFQKKKGSVREMNRRLHLFKGHDLGEAIYNATTNQVELTLNPDPQPVDPPIDFELNSEKYRDISDLLKKPFFREIVLLNNLSKVLNDSIYKEPVAKNVEKLSKQRETIIKQFVKSQVFHPAFVQDLRYIALKWAKHHREYEEYYFKELGTHEIIELVLMNDADIRNLFKKYKADAYNFNSIERKLDNIARYQNQSLQGQFQEYLDKGIIGDTLIRANYIPLFISLLCLFALFPFWAAMLRDFTFIKLLFSGLVGLGVGIFIILGANLYHYESCLFANVNISILYVSLGMLGLGSLGLWFIASFFSNRIGVLGQILHLGLHSTCLLFIFTSLIDLSRGTIDIEVLKCLPSQNLFAFYMIPTLIFSYIMTYILLRKINLVPRRK